MQNRKIRDIRIVAAVVSVLNSLMFHIPFFSYVCQHVESGVNGSMIVVSLAVIMLAANYFAFYLILYLGRIVGKVLTGLLFIGNAASLYFINTYDVIIDDSMMGNVFNTNWSEATSYWSLSALLYILLMGVLPFVLILMVKIDYGSLKRFFRNVGAGLLVVVLVVFANMPNWMWIDKNSTVIGSLLLPWSYVVNAVRFQNEQREMNREEIKLPDARIKDSAKCAVVLVIGESSRRDHYSLYGYERQTNPLLSARGDIKSYKANSSATYTTGGVKAILEDRESSRLYEILPNYLYRTGVEVTWRSSNWGQPPLHIEHEYDIDDLAAVYGVSEPLYDALLAKGLKEAIDTCGRDKALFILHTSTSHGPEYPKRYPPEFEVFSPVSHTVEMANCPKDELINGYDNTIVYTDYIINDIICQMERLDGWNSCVMFVSDHGESLGENNLYMHGVPMSIAPPEQYEIPFIVWTSMGTDIMKDAGLLGQHHVFHSVLHFLGIESPVYNGEFDIFAF